MSEPLFEPGDGSLGILYGQSARFMRTRNHHDRNPKLAGGFDLRIGRSSPRVLGNKHIDLLLPEECRLGSPVEGASVKQQPDMWRQRDIFGRVDRARDIMMMRSLCEGTKLEATEGEKNMTRLRSKRVGGGFRARHHLPYIIRLRLPCGARDRGQRDRELPARGHDMGRDLIGVGMRRVNDGLYFLLLQPCGKPVDAAKAADPHWNGLHPGIRSAPGKRKRDFKAAVVRKQMRQLRGLCRTSEDKNAHRGLFHDC